MGLRIEKVKAEWEVVRAKALKENWEAYKAEFKTRPWRIFHHGLDVFTESFRHGPYFSSHVIVPIWLVALLVALAW